MIGHTSKTTEPGLIRNGKNGGSSGKMNLPTTPPPEITNAARIVVDEGRTLTTVDVHEAGVLKSGGMKPDAVLEPLISDKPNLAPYIWY